MDRGLLEWLMGHKLGMKGYCLADDIRMNIVNSLKQLTRFSGFGKA